MAGLEHAKRVIKIIVGFLLLAAGIAMIVLPGPGLLVIMLGLATLSTEFEWARRWMERVKSAARTARDTITRREADPRS